MKFITYILPSYLASYLINGDASGLEEREVQEADAMIERLGHGLPVCISDESSFCPHHDFIEIPWAGDCAEYTFYEKEKEEMPGTDFHKIDFHMTEGAPVDAKTIATQYSFRDLRAGLLRDTDSTLERVELACLYLLGMIDFAEYAERKEGLDCGRSVNYLPRLK